MIEILDTFVVADPITNEPMSRSARIAITKAGQSQSFEWGVGGLPLVGDIRVILDGREEELWRDAQERGRVHDLFSVRQEKIIKALALVIMDELNILRANAGLVARSQTQIENAIKTKIGRMS